MENKKIVVIPGDGIGPEITESALSLAKAVAPQLEYEKLDQELAYSTQEDLFWSRLESSPAILKGPTSTPGGGGRRSLNVMIRTRLGLFSNVRPVRSLDPFVECSKPVDLVIVRENEEDLYIGMEYQQSHQQAHAVKIATNYASERICRYAYELAIRQSRSRLTCMTKQNILKLTDGMFLKNFRELESEYESVSTDHKIIDIGAALVSTDPQKFDVIVTTNLYGDIISDIAAQVAGSVGLAGSANVGDSSAMFEAIHGSAPDIAGRGMANPSGLISATVMMLHYLGLGEEAVAMESAWLKAIEDGLGTPDMKPKGRQLSTRDFTSEILRRLGESPVHLSPSRPLPRIVLPPHPPAPTSPFAGDVIGVDIFVLLSPPYEQLAIVRENLKQAYPNLLALESIWNRGVKVDCLTPASSWMSDQWRFRFVSPHRRPLNQEEVWSFVRTVSSICPSVIRAETLVTGGSGNLFSE
jgi:isocitrate dehydrogenase